MRLKSSKNVKKIFPKFSSDRGFFEGSSLFLKNFRNFLETSLKYYPNSITFLQFSKVELKISHLDKILTYLLDFFRDPRINGIHWDPISKNADDRLRCFEIRSPTDYSMYEWDYEPIIEFWEKLIPSEEPPTAYVHPSRFRFEFRQP